MARREKLSRTFEKFEAGLIKLKEATTSDFESKFDKDILVEIVTKRFEYTFESMWKCLKEILLAEGIQTESPLSCFKEAFKLGLIDKKQEEVFPFMVKKRNEIVHIYSDEDAYEIYLLIKSTFLEVISNLFEKIRVKI
ncbi:MAG: nucleotidyltransferase substrate binding protein [Deltaproteobacteria bacterium]|nr:nucleotidyltransferase substrate binding protein [Deltaproteobacteria bacterium]